MYNISYHHKILVDLAKINSTDKKIIQNSIETKLVFDPEFFGKPLQFSLKGIRSMRVGNYRVVFQIIKKEVFVILIEHRSTVYKSITKRI